MKISRSRSCGFCLLAMLFACSGSEPSQEDPANWAHYLGDRATTQYSALQQIDTGNVARLTQVWSYASGDLDSLNRGQIQCNPLIVDGVLYGTNPRLKAFALDAATGRERWTFDPAVFSEELFGMGTNRGLSYWTDGEERRIYYPAGAFLYALDATTGQPVTTFGTGGRVDLHTGLGDAAREQFVVSTSPGIIFEDLIIVGGRVSEDLGAAPGHIRAFDLHTGALRWTFKTLPDPGTPGVETWPAERSPLTGGANAWAGMSLDAERGHVFIPTGSASYDFYGGNRPGDNLYANSVLVLDARSGERIWHYQTVHHDVWDRDLPAPPVLLTVNHGGRDIEAVAQTTKGGYLFLFDRDSGTPLFPVEERPFPASDLAGEYSSPTQPIPTSPPPFTRQELTPEDLYPFDTTMNREARELLARSRYGGPFLPPSEEGTIMFPGFDGGAEWGGAAWSPSDRLLFVNANEMPWMLKMNPVEGLAGADSGRGVYAIGCQACHGADLRGGGVFQSPSLLGLADRLDAPAITQLIRNGRGAMPAIGWLTDEQVKAVAEWLLTLDADASPEEITAEAGASDKEEATGEGAWPYPYIMDGYKRLKTSDGHPITSPPWGTLTAIDLDKGDIRWQVPLGEYPDLVERGIRSTGSENYGGPVATAGGLVFIAATLDEKIRAFRSRDGKLLWEAPLPAAGYATPSVYSVSGRQYVVVACGGGKLGTPSGDRYVAFALPE
ncbi:quinoprotein glucose dehydrogenase [Lewinella marina]|uniref:Pyrrolo-quinoline quinone n=1 Tax=Neolewinella marina TaxID=438751 RepID=A0A2G0CJY5_9BACT|nr:PQQ-binding-like beta-propeller repeat protein [Neolewinella marina]NJB84531.1 quinoprotein glucose dehydrogenase [Neolewinella marina]PHL00284.1 pyrrolo-quinoline quinone [Neolewinella marina]